MNGIVAFLLGAAFAGPLGVAIGTLLTRSNTPRPKVPRLRMTCPEHGDNDAVQPRLDLTTFTVEWTCQHRVSTPARLDQPAWRTALLRLLDQEPARVSSSVPDTYEAGAA